MNGSRAWWGLVLVVGTVAAAGRAAQPEAEVVPGHVDVIVPFARVPHLAIDRVRHGVRLAEAEAQVSIAEQVATTTLRLRLENPGLAAREAMLLLPVPFEATVRTFELEGAGEAGLARMLPRDEARRLYDEIVRKTRDPALLEFVQYNALRTSVFPVPGKGSQVVRLVYEQLLPAEGDRLEYVLPRTRALEAAEVTWSLSATIRSTRPIATVYSASHELELKRRGPGEVEAKVAAGAAGEPGPFRLSVLLAQADGAGVMLLAYPDAGVGDGRGGYFLLVGGLGEPAATSPRLAREVLLVIDRSGSMRGEKMAQAREAARQIIAGLDDGERFNIIDYADTVERFAAVPVEVRAQTRADATAYLARLEAGGGTNLHAALVEALRQEHTADTLPMVVFLTDGLPTVGERDEVAIREAAEASNRYGRRVFTVGVGYDVNAPLVTGVARASRGAPLFVLPGEDLEVKVSQLFRRLTGPVVALPVLEVLDAAGEPDTRQVRALMPEALPDLFAGDQLIVLGQYLSEGPLRFRLRGESGAGPRTVEFAVSTAGASTVNDAVPRLWATRRIAVLLEQIRALGASEGPRGSGSPTDDPALRELVDEVVRLSMRWGVLTEYTAFLASEQDREEARRAEDFMGALEAAASEAVVSRAMRARAGRGAVSQDVNLGELYAASTPRLRTRYFDASMEEVEIRTVQPVGDWTLYRRGSRWVEAALLEDEDAKPERVITYGTVAWDALVDRLVGEGRNALLGLAEEVYVQLDGERVLIRGPAVER